MLDDDDDEGRGALCPSHVDMGKELAHFQHRSFGLRLPTRTNLLHLDEKPSLLSSRRASVNDLEIRQAAQMRPASDNEAS